MPGQIISKPVAISEIAYHVCLIEIGKRSYQTNTQIKVDRSLINTSTPINRSIYECSCGERYILDRWKLVNEPLYIYQRWRPISRWWSNVIMWHRRRKKISDSESPVINN